jgi:transcription antitermination factor NusG
MLTVETDAIATAGAPATEFGAVPSFAGWFHEAPGPWWVVHTRSRHEKVVAEALAKRRVPHYLPLARMIRTYEKCRINVELPLFPGYMFIGGGHEACDAAWKTNRVANILEVKNQEQLRGELAQIYQVLRSGETVDLQPALQAGRRCRIVGGALEGLEGVIQRRGRHCRMHLAVTILGQSAVVEVDGALLEPLD